MKIQIQLLLFSFDIMKELIVVVIFYYVVVTNRKIYKFFYSQIIF